MSKELKPCPFCASENIMIDDLLKLKSHRTFTAFCGDCAAKSANCLSYSDAVSAWNTRADGWISVDDRLPDDENAWCLVFADGAMNCMMYGANGFYDATHSRCNNASIDDITHWMPLPAPPSTK